MGSFGGRTGIVQGSFGGRSGVVRGSFGDRSEVVRGSFGVVRESFGGRSRIIRIVCGRCQTLFLDNLFIVFRFGSDVVQSAAKK